MSPAQKSRKPSTELFTEEEKAAAREAVRERRARSRPGAVDGERAVLEKIATFPPSDRAMAERIHAIVRENAPDLSPRTWYGMPAYGRDGQVVVFFQNASKFKMRYATLGFSDSAHLDDGRMWATGFALTELTGAEEAKIAALVRRAAAVA